MSDDELLEQFEACSLPASAFHHQEHVRVAFVYLQKYPILEAPRRFSGSLTNFATATASPTSTTRPSTGLTCC